MITNRPICDRCGTFMRETERIVSVRETTAYFDCNRDGCPGWQAVTLRSV